MKVFFTGVKGLGIYLLFAIAVWMVLTAGVGWSSSSFGPPNEQLNSRDLFLCFTVFPIIALGWPLVLLLIGGIDAGGRRLGIITDIVPQQR